MFITMRRFISLRRFIAPCLIALMVLGGLSARAVGEDPGSGELQGTWKLVYQQIDGKMLPDEKAAARFHGKMDFDGSELHYSVELPGFDFRFSYLLHPEQQPRGMDLKLLSTPDGQDIGRVVLGIYRIVGDTLTICYGSTRPTGFAAAEGSRNTLIVLRR